MPLLNKRSDTEGNRANLIPGEIGHNRADDKLLIRGSNRKLEIDLDKWRRRAPPLSGEAGAPLILTEDDTVEWGGALTPIGYANGKASVDAPPVSWGVPGLLGSSASTAFVAAQAVRVEPFYVASDKIIITHLAIRVETGSAGVARLAIYDVADNLLAEEAFLNSAPELLAVEHELELPRGWYKAVVWVKQAVTLLNLEGGRYNQPFGFDDFAPVFSRYLQGTGNMEFAMELPSVALTPVLVNEPGEDHAILLRWTLP